MTLPTTGGLLGSSSCSGASWRASTGTSSSRCSGSRGFLGGYSGRWGRHRPWRRGRCPEARVDGIRGRGQASAQTRADHAENQPRRPHVVHYRGRRVCAVSDHPAPHVARHPRRLHSHRAGRISRSLSSRRPDVTPSGLAAAAARTALADAGREPRRDRHRDLRGHHQGLPGAGSGERARRRRGGRAGPDVRRHELALGRLLLPVIAASAACTTTSVFPRPRSPWKHRRRSHPPGA